MENGFASLSELADDMRQCLSFDEAREVVFEAVREGRARIKRKSNGQVITWKELRSPTAGNVILPVDFDPYGSAFPIPSCHPVASGPGSRADLFTNGDYVFEREPSMRFAEREFGVNFSRSVTDREPAVAPETRAAGGRPNMWDWDRLKARAFRHFTEQGFEPPDAKRKPAVDQIAAFITKEANGIQNEDGVVLRLSDAKPYAEAVYDALQNDFAEVSFRKKRLRQ